VAEAGSARLVVQLWRDSPLHRDLLLLPDATEMGVGQQARYWCVELGTRPLPSIMAEPSR
jgi:uncharacterized protein YkwD